MEFNWSSVPNSSVNYDDSGSISNSQPDISGAHGTIAHDGNGMDLELVPYTQPESEHSGQTLYSTSHYASSELGMSSMGICPDIFSTPKQSLPEGSDYGCFPNSSFSGVSYMEGLESTQNTGMMYGEYQETSFNTMNLDNYNNSHHSTVLPPSSFFNSTAHAAHGMHSTIPVGTPIYGHADVHAQVLNFGLDLNLNLDLHPALKIPTSTMPNSIPLLTPTLLPSTSTQASIATAASTTVADKDHHYYHGRNHEYDDEYDYDTNHGTPASDLPEQEASTSANKSRNKKGNGKRVYRTSYDHHPSHRYTCHACRFSTDVKRDFFGRHVKTKKHKSKILRGQQQREEQREEIRCARGQKQQEGEEDGDEDKEAIRRMR